MAQRVDISDSGVADSNQRSPNATSPHTEQPSSHRLELYDELLTIDLSKHKANVDKLYEFCKALQVLCQEQRSEIAQLRAEAVANLAKSPSTGSTRRETDDSELSQKKELKDTPGGIAVVFSPSDNGLRILQRKDMKDSNYIQAALPSFHWWQDCLHVYFGKNPDRKSTTYGQPQATVLKKKLDTPSNRDLIFIRTIKLGGLGFSIKWRRMTGRLNTIYVLSPQPQHVQSTPLEMTFKPMGLFVAL